MLPEEKEASISITPLDPCRGMIWGLPLSTKTITSEFQPWPGFLVSKTNLNLSSLWALSTSETISDPWRHHTVPGVYTWNPPKVHLRPGSLSRCHFHITHKQREGLRDSLTFTMQGSQRLCLAHTSLASRTLDANALWELLSAWVPRKTILSARLYPHSSTPFTVANKKTIFQGGSTDPTNAN